MAAADDTPEPGPEVEMTLGDHLDELRKRLFRGVIVLFVCIGALWAYRDTCYAIIMAPFQEASALLREDWLEELEERLAEDPSLPRTTFFMTADPEDQRLVPRYEIDDRPLVTGWQEGFIIKLRVCLYFALFIGGPYFLWQLWGFIAAGLYKSERRVIGLYFPASVVLFFTGILFGYFKMVPIGLYFLSSEMRPEQINASFSLDKYFTLFSGLCLALGVVFQLPVLMVGLYQLGLIEAKSYALYRGHFAFAATLIAAILTPPDPITLGLLALPMVVLYEVGILIVRFLDRKRARAPGEVVA